MMAHKNEIYNWLIMAYSAPCGGWLGETFYFDRRDKELYSVHPFDMLMINEDGSQDRSVKSSYTDHVEKKLIDKIIRRERDDNDILEIPFLSIPERQSGLRLFADTVENANLRDELCQRSKNQVGDNWFDAYFDATVDNSVREKWAIFKTELLRNKIDAFLTENNIDIENISILEI